MSIDPAVMIADAIVAYLPTQSYTGQAITADDIERRYFDFGRMIDLSAAFKVIVSPMELAPSRESRACALVYTPIVSVFVKGYCQDGSNAAIDPWRDLVMDIINHLYDQVMAGYAQMQFEEPTFFDSDLIVQNNTFINELRVLYRG